MLHWLEVDSSGVVREGGDLDGNSTLIGDPFTGRAIETFEQSPTKSVSSWKEGKRDGETTEFFYNGRKRTIIEYSNGVREGTSREYRITGELQFEETYIDGKLN